LSSSFWILRLNPYVECEFFFVASRLSRSRGSGLGQRSPSKRLPPRTPLAKRVYSGVYRQEVAGWLRLRDLQKAPRLGGHPGALAGRHQKGSNRVRPSTESSPPPELPSQRYSNSSVVDCRCHRARMKLLWGYVHSHGRTCEASL